MQKLGVSMVAAALLVAIPESRAQIADWAKVLRDLANDQDRSAQAAAVETYDRLSPTLQTEDAASLEKDVRSIAALLDDKDAKVKFKASAVLVVLTMLRQDTTEPLKGILPVLFAHLHDPDAPVAIPLVSPDSTRLNVVRVVAGLRPSIPPEALRELLPLLHDPDRTVQDVAIYGVTRSVPQSPDARKALLDVLNGGDVGLKVDALKDVGFVGLRDPAIIEKLRQLLSDKDRSVILAAIVALDYAGVAAAPARAELERIQTDPSDPELSRAAASVIAKIDRH